jgi:aarF domain-containing kinase
MSPALSELIAALPEETVGVAWPPRPGAPPQEWLRAVPTGRWTRFAALGTLQAKIAAAYLFHWLRGWFRDAPANQKHLAETHWRTAVQMLDTMCYLRGALMKAGQTLANFPDIAPPEFVDTLNQLHFNAPPMHYSLLRELVHNELGDDPEGVFAAFDRQAFAAASIGQVHRARLRTGADVAVKIQYPGIARTIQSDFRNVFLCLLPARLGKDWENTKDQFDDLRQRLEQETDYGLEADRLERARTLFREEDGIVIPRVHREYCTARVLTTDRLTGRHLTEFLAGDPSQEERNAVARKIVRAWYRLMYAGRMLYVDFHPGNFLVMDDGRLGMLDFGYMVELDDAEWDWYRRIDRPLTTGLKEDRLPVLQEWSDIRDDETERLRLSDEYAQWSWMARYRGGEYDFADEAEFRHGINLFTEMVRKRYSRARPNTPTIARGQFAWRAVLFQLRAKFDIRAIAEEEVLATGWDRSDYTETASGG